MSLLYRYKEFVVPIQGGNGGDQTRREVGEGIPLTAPRAVLLPVPGGDRPALPSRDGASPGRRGRSREVFAMWASRPGRTRSAQRVRFVLRAVRRGVRLSVWNEQGSMTSASSQCRAISRPAAQSSVTAGAATLGRVRRQLRVAHCRDGGRDGERTRRGEVGRDGERTRRGEVRSPGAGTNPVGARINLEVKRVSAGPSLTACRTVMV